MRSVLSSGKDSATGAAPSLVSGTAPYHQGVPAPTEHELIPDNAPGKSEVVSIPDGTLVRVPKASPGRGVVVALLIALVIAVGLAVAFALHTSNHSGPQERQYTIAPVQPNK